MTTPSTYGEHDRERIAEFVRGAKRGDPQAFDTLYKHYLSPIYRFVYFRVKSEGDAEDLTQHIFIKAWNALQNFEERGKPFSAWLYAIARNAVIDHWKKKKELRLEESEEANLKIMDDPDPQEIAAHKEDGARLRDAIRILTEDQQEIIVLKFIEDRTNSEIAEITDKSEDAIRQLQFRALKALRAHFKDSQLI